MAVAPAAPTATAATTPEIAHAAPSRFALAGAPHDMAATTTTPLAVRPVAMQFNAQLGTLVPAPQLGEPLAAAMPAPAGDTKTAAPAARGKAMPAAVEAPVAAVQSAVAATFIAAITPVAVATFAPGSVPAAPAPGNDDLAASAILATTPAVAPAVPGGSPPRGQSASPDVTAAAAAAAVAPAAAAASGMPAAAVLPAPPVSNTIAADTAVDARPAPHPRAGAADTPGMPAKAGTVGAPFAAPVASNAGSLDAERNVAATTAAVTPATGLGLTAPVVASTLPAQGGDIIKLNGTAQQWQEPLREALGERLQTQIGRNSEHAVIRLDPPMLGRIDISIRHTAGMLQVNLSASNMEVLRQLQGIGETMRTDLAQRQYTEVAVNISATPRSPAAQAFAEGDARGQRQPGRQQDEAEPGRALSDGTPAGAPYGATFAMHEREYN
jgi:flagellar hook-length control protein FliK